MNTKIDIFDNVYLKCKVEIYVAILLFKNVKYIILNYN